MPASGFQIALDNCVRADETPLSFSGKWSNVTSTCDLVSNTIRAHSTSAARCLWAASADQFVPDQWAEMTIGTCSTGSDFVGACVRSIAGAGYAGIVQGPLGAGAHLFLQKTGVNQASGVFTVNAGDVIRIEALDALASTNVIVNVYLNGVQKLTFTDTASLITSGQPGLNFVVVATANGQVTSFNAGVCKPVQNGILADYRLQDGSGTTATDSSANANNGTLGSAGNAPTWVPTTGGLAFSGGQFVTLPAGVQAAKTFQAFVNYTNDNDANSFSAIFMGNGAVGTSVGFMFARPDMGTGTTQTRKLSSGSRWASYANGAFASSSRDAVPNGNNFFSLVMSTTVADVFYLNGAVVQKQVASAILSAVQASGNYQLGGCAAGSGMAAQSYFTGTVYYALMYNRSLSAAEATGNERWVRAFMANLGVNETSPGNTGTTSQLVTDGDSITEAYNALATPWTESLSLNFTMNKANQGLSSAQLQTGVGLSLIDFAAKSVDRIFHPNAPRNICVIWAGSNDYAVGARTAAQTYASLQTYCTARRAVGWKVIVVTMISRSDSGADTFKNSYNTLIRAGTGVDYDALADLHTSGIFDLTADGAFNNVTYFADGIHPTQTAHTNVIAPIISAAINGLSYPRSGGSIMLF